MSRPRSTTLFARGLRRARRAIDDVRRIIRPDVVGVYRTDEGSDVSVVVPFDYDLSGVRPAADRTAVVCHLFHVDLLPEFAAALRNVRFPVDLFISTDTVEKQRRIRSAFEHWTNGGVDVRIAPNRGRDIGPKLVTFRDVYDRYDLILFLHSKKSVNSEAGNDWRRYLVRTLLGSPAVVNSIVEIFERHPDVGIVMPQHFHVVRPIINWDRNFPLARRLARRMGIELTPQHLIDFPSGSMFWARTEALRPLLDLRLSTADFPEEDDQTRCTVQHGIERLFLYACESAGYRWVKIVDDAGDETSRRVASASELADFIDANRFSLLS